MNGIRDVRPVIDVRNIGKKVIVKDNSRKKLLHIVEAFGGGIYTFIVSLANATCEEYDVTVLFAIRPQTPENYKDDFDSRITLIESKYLKRSIDPIKDVAALFEIRKYVKKIKPDIIHLHSSKAGILGRVGINCQKNKVFYTPHGYSFLKEDDSKLKREIYWDVEKVGAWTNCKTVAVSEGEYDVARLLGRNCTYINNGISINNLTPSYKPIDHKNPLIATLGRISFQKNPKVFNQIAEAFPALRFMWIGDGELREELKSGNIEITGWKEHFAALKLLNECDIFILPSLWEGLPISLLEAMYMGKICIVSNIIGNKDVIKTAANGFVANKTEDYIRIIKDITGGDYDVAEIAKIAHEEVLNEYNTDVMIRKYMDLYRV